MPGPVRIVEYDQQWPARFENERARILAAIGERVVAVEHIGSTSVPGLAAKPTVDMMVALSDLRAAEQCIAPLEAIGYTYQYVLAFGPPGWHYLSRRDTTIDLGYHIHITEVGSAFWREHLAFRDYLRAHPEAMAQYAELKRGLAGEHGEDRIGYCNAKTEFIQAVVRQALSE
ncbi:MAG: GrpB family protein [Anaerolineae bacterium]